MCLASFAAAPFPKVRKIKTISEVRSLLLKSIGLVGMTSVVELDREGAFKI